MGEFEMIWTILALVGRDLDAASPLAKSLAKWARDNKRVLKLEAQSPATQRTTKTISWRGLMTLARLRAAMPVAGDAAELFALTDQIAKAVEFDDFNARLLAYAAASERLSLVDGLVRLLMEGRVDMLTLFGEASGAIPREAARRVRQSEVLRLGLVRFQTNKAGNIGIEPSWTMDKLLDRGAADEAVIVDALVGRRQMATLSLVDFPHIGAPADFIVRLLRGALDERAGGVNILLYGPPGTGKTELAKAVAAGAGASLFSVGEADEDGAEPSRWDRVTAYKLAQRVVERRSGTILLFDEMEDLIGSARPTGDDYFTGRDGSKVFVNRLFETNAAPTIWTTNALGNVDPAILRRMSFVLKLDYPTPIAARAMLGRVAADEQVGVTTDALGRLIDHAPETSTVLRTALKAGRLAKGGEADAAETAMSLVGALRGAKLRLPAHNPADLDLALYEGDCDMGALLTQLADGDTPSDFSLLLTGPPGTGKTALAHHLAHRLERPLIVKRASDLLSKWVGETEQQIAEAFEEAIAKNGVLLFDEVDSLLADRSNAQRSWEVTQVNELLTWFDSHPLPFIAATNHRHKLDPAAMRRFVFKLDLKPLSAAKAAAAYARFFGAEAPPALARLQGLTPGDLAVVVRQLRYLKDRPSSGDILARLAAELAAKPEGGGRIGF